jgi:hypothetical protein
MGNLLGEADHASHGARSQSESHAIEPRKCAHRGSLCRFRSGGHAVVPQWSGTHSPAGVEEHGQTDNGGSPGTWEILSSPRQIPGRRYRVNNSRPPGRTGYTGGANDPCNRGTAKRRQRSAAEGAAGSHSALIVPPKRGNGSRPDPVEGSEASDHENVLEKHDGCIEIRPPCPRNGNG